MYLDFINLTNLSLVLWGGDWKIYIHMNLYSVTYTIIYFYPFIYSIFCVPLKYFSIFLNSFVGTIKTILNLIFSLKKVG